MIQIPAVIERCAGIDVGKRELAVAVIVGPADQDGEMKTRAFGTTVPALEELRQWLMREGCTSVAMESTGSPVSPETEAQPRSEGQQVSDGDAGSRRLGGGSQTGLHFPT